jgi:hypothetical protein
MASRICAPVLYKTLFMLLGLLFCKPSWLLASKIMWMRFAFVFAFPPNKCKFHPITSLWRLRRELEVYFLPIRNPVLEGVWSEPGSGSFTPRDSLGTYRTWAGWVPRVDLDGRESLAPSGIRPPDSFIPRKTLRIRHSLFQLCHFTSESLIIPCFGTV